MTKVNKHGVIEGGEEIVLINEGNRSVAIVTIEHLPQAVRRVLVDLLWMRLV